VPANKSGFPDYIVCLEDGQQFQTLKRHLMTAHQMTPEQYRQRWDLPRSYPIVAPNYTKSRSAIAKSLGLGPRRVPHPGASRRVGDDNRHLSGGQCGDDLRHSLLTVIRINPIRTNRIIALSAKNYLLAIADDLAMNNQGLQQGQPRSRDHEDHDVCRRGPDPEHGCGIR
jgi:hypothetical protein